MGLSTDIGLIKKSVCFTPCARIELIEWGNFPRLSDYLQKRQIC